MADRLPPDRHAAVDRHLIALRHERRSHTLTVHYEVKDGRLVRVRVEPPAEVQKILDVQDDEAHNPIGA